eukprot:890410-Alexandrium_andersonii.AAC.1
MAKSNTARAPKTQSSAPPLAKALSWKQHGPKRGRSTGDGPDAQGETGIRRQSAVLEQPAPRYKGPPRQTR